METRTLTIVCLNRANPELYLEELRSRQAEQAAKVEQRKRQKTGSFHHHCSLLF